MSHTAPIELDVPLDERALSKLRWRCRRGLLENDLFIERFLDLSDNDLLDLLLGRQSPQAELADPDVVSVLSLLRAARPTV